MKKRIIVFYSSGIAALLFALFMISSCTLLFTCTQVKVENFEFDKLTCEYQKNPLGIESPKPRFSWTLNSILANQSQSAYSILVAKSQTDLIEGKADIWDSGKINTSQSIAVKYAGKALESATKYWWKVKIWNQDGIESKWSTPQSFETGLLKESDWCDALWISMEKDNRVSEHRSREIFASSDKNKKHAYSYPTAYFRKEIELKHKLKKARAYVCGLGYYELYINGEKIGDHVLDPAPTSYDDNALYVTYDITEHFNLGQNTIGVILGNGFYGQNIAFLAPLDYGKPNLKMLVKLYYDDGSIQNIVSNEYWKVTDGPIVFDNVYAGETYDARFEIDNWNRPGFNDEKWQNAFISQPEVGELISQQLPPIKKIKNLNPIDIFKSKNGNWIVDFGQNIAGWVKIKVKENRGSVIQIRTAEALMRSLDDIHTGSLGVHATGVEQIDKYICRGDDWEEWEPRFTYNGFRYAEISGLSEKPEPNSITAVLVHSDVEKIGSFYSSNSLLNDMVNISEWTVVDNLHGLPEDCPHREKCGWLGDAHVNAQFCLYTYDMTLFYEKYARDIKSQLNTVMGNNDNGTEFFSMPTMVAPGKRNMTTAKLDWGIAEIYIPWYIYLHVGDMTAIEDHYAAMKDMVNYYLTFKNSDGIIENGLGDWCPPLWDRLNNPDAMECHPFISANAYFYDVLKVMHHISGLMNDVDYGVSLLKEAEELQKSFNQQFLTNIDGADLKWYGSQTATVMALKFGMVPETARAKVLEGLKHDIILTHKGHHSTGIHGGRHIYSILSEMNEKELAYNLLITPEFPSQAYIINVGMTTWPERQWEWGSGIEWDRSLNHPMHSGFAAFFYESLGGIKPLASHPGFKKFKIEPIFLDEVDFVKSSIESPHGKISVDWEKRETKIVLSVSIPFNTEAIIQLPLSASSTIEIRNDFDGEVVSFNGRFDTKTNDLVLGSGEYTILLSDAHQSQ